MSQTKAAASRAWRARSGGRAGALERRAARDALRTTFADNPQRYREHPTGLVVDLETGTVYGPRCRPLGSLTTHGYVNIDLRSRFGIQRRAHQVVWESVHGPVPSGLEINHRNGVKTDNTLANLELVTRQQNILHAYAIGLKNNQGENHPQHKLTAEDVKEIRRSARIGDAQKWIGMRFGISRRQVCDIVNRRSWAHLEDC
jgi:hypothetical protein